MGGFFGVASKQDCVLELFYGVDFLALHRNRIVCWSFSTAWTTILISAREEAEWLFMAKTGLTARSII